MSGEPALRRRAPRVGALSCPARSDASLFRWCTTRMWRWRHLWRASWRAGRVGSTGQPSRLRGRFLYRRLLVDPRHIDPHPAGTSTAYQPQLAAGMTVLTSAAVGQPAASSSLGHGPTTSGTNLTASHACVSLPSRTRARHASANFCDHNALVAATCLCQQHACWLTRSADPGCPWVNSQHQRLQRLRAERACSEGAGSLCEPDPAEEEAARSGTCARARPPCGPKFCRACTDVPC